MLKKIVFGFLISNFLLFACNSMNPLQTNLGKLKGSLNGFKAKLVTLNTKLGELKRKLEGKPAASMLSMNLQELIKMIKSYDETATNLSDAAENPFLVQNIPEFEATLKDIESKIPKATENLELIGDAADTKGISVQTLNHHIEFIQKYFTELKTLKLKNFKFRNNFVYDIKFKDLDSLELKNIENLCAFKIESKVNVLKISVCNQLGDQSVATGNAKAMTGIFVEKETDVKQISITDCTKLDKIRLLMLANLTKLNISDCNALTEVFIQDCPSLTELFLTGNCHNLSNLSIISNLNQQLKIVGKQKSDINNFEAPKEEKIVWTL